MPALRHPFVLFDAGDTLIGPRVSFGSVYARVLAGLGIDVPAEALERGLRTCWKEINQTLVPGTDRYRLYPGGESEYWSRFVARTLAVTPGAPDDPTLPRRALDPLREEFRNPSTWQVFPDVVPVLGALQSMGVRLGVVSNWDSRLPALLAALGLASRFEVIVVSHLEGIEKPRPEIFLRAVTLLGARPEETLHVGDVPELDEAGARAAGLNSVLVDRHGRLDVKKGAVADLTPIPSIASGGRA